MKNKLVDLNNHLFAELERLGDEDLKGEDLSQEVERARSITGIATQIVANAALTLKAVQLQCEMGTDKNIGLTGLIGDGKGDQ